MFKPSTILPVARSSVFGRARRTGRLKDESAPVTMSFWNGANGSRPRSHSIVRRDLMFRLTAYELGNAGSDRTTGGRVRWDSLSYLSRHSNPGADKRTPAVGGPRSHGAVGRSNSVPARPRRDRGNFSPRHELVRRSRPCFQTPI